MMNTAVAEQFDAYNPVRVEAIEHKERSLSDRATRYGIRFIRDTVDLAPRDFLRHELEANRFHNFETFQFYGPSEQMEEKSPGILFDRLAGSQITELTSKGFIDLKEVAKLNNAEDAARIFNHLVNPAICTKYPFDLGRRCTTCWLAYLRSPEFQARDFSDLSEDAFEALKKTHTQVVKAMEDALATARNIVTKAASDIDNTAVGKSSYDPFDFVCVRHTHLDMPTYKTSNPQAQLATAIGEAIRGVAAPEKQGNDLEAENAALKARLEALEASIVQDTAAADDVSFAKGDKVLVEGREGVVVGRMFGKYKVEFEDGTTALRLPEDVNANA